MGYWAKAPMAREQLVLIATTLDDRISDDHPVRLYAEILQGYDWSKWESQYDGRRGQPPSLLDCETPCPNPNRTRDQPNPKINWS